MSSEIYEIIELSNGDVALRRAGGDEEALVCIQFSSESLKVIGGYKVAVAKAMLEAGIEAVQDLGKRGEFENLEEESGEFVEHTLH
ncbi:MAG: hypothetical protein K0U59_07180 [Gammaproteobacteria bacterium]|nr:hypothetical protein [Gammaproteobacteria bacterium]